MDGYLIKAHPFEGAFNSLYTEPITVSLERVYVISVALHLCNKAEVCKNPLMLAGFEYCGIFF